MTRESGKRTSRTPGVGHLSAALEDTARAGFQVTALRLLAYSVGFVASVAISRAVGPEGRGLYAFPLAVLAITVTLSHLGLQQGNVFLASRGVPLQVLWANATVAAIVITSFVWLALALLYLLATPTLGGLPLPWFAVPLSQVPLLLMTIYWTSLLQLNGQVAGAALASFGGVCVQTLMVLVLFVGDGLTPFRVLILAAAANGTTWLLVFAIGMRGGLARPGFDRSFLWKALLFGLKTYPGLILFLLVLRADELLVRDLLGYRALGLYSLAVTFAELLWLLTDPLAAALLRHQVLGEEGDERRLGYIVARLSLLVACSAGVLAWVVSPYVITLVYGKQFAGAIWPFRVLIPGIVAIAVQRPLTAIVVKDGRPWLITTISGIALLLNVLLNLILLPRVGVVGASIACTACYVLLCVAYVVVTYRGDVVAWRDLIPRGSDVRLLLSGVIPGQRHRADGPPRVGPQ